MMRALLVILAAGVLLYAALLKECALPALENRPASAALSKEEARATALGAALAPHVDAHPGLSGVYALADPRDAFAARMLLARAAERTLDVQYYIWRGDMTGTLLLEALYEAAERGVRVRLLLDDNGTSGLDDVLAALHSHANIEVRLFNPFKLRWPKALGYLTDFARLNRRMHNKSFTADNQVTLVGGRNIGDEYFGASEGVLFADLDVMAVGQVVSEASSDFDRYWQSASSYPVDQLLPAAQPSRLAALQDSASTVKRNPAAGVYMRALQEAVFVRQLLRGELPMEWAVTSMVSDDPAKALGQAPPEALMLTQLDEVLDTPRKQLDLVSPYFVPTATGTQALLQLVRRGVRVRVLTNALEATDVAVVHSGYAKHRKDLLRGGVELYEMRSQTVRGKRPQHGPFGSSGSSLHAKTFAVDGERVFVGSFNFDPRSARLNTELGFVIDSPLLARQVTQAFKLGVPEASYQPMLDEHERLYWIARESGAEKRYDTEPGSSWLQRASVRILQWLPLEPLL